MSQTLTLAEGEALSASKLTDMLRLVSTLPTELPADLAASDAERIDRIRLLERIKCALGAVQTAETARFAFAQIAGKPLSKQRTEKIRRSTACQVGLARGESPTRGSIHVGAAKMLTTEMPHTMAAFHAGDVTEYQAIVMVRETATLSEEHRRQVDAELAGKLGQLNDKEIAQRAAAIGYRLDAQQAVDRHRKAVKDAHVGVRPAPDGMSYVTATVPLQEGVAVYAALDKHARTAKAVGDERSRGRIMADEFVNRIVHPAVAAAEPPTVVEDAVQDETNPGVDGAVIAVSLASHATAVIDLDSTEFAAETHAGHPSCESIDSDASSSADQDSALNSADVPSQPQIQEPTGLSTTAEQTSDDAVPSPAPATFSTAFSVASDARTVQVAAAGALGGLMKLPAGVNLDIQLVMTDRTLLDGDAAPAVLTGYGPIPAPLARELAASATENLQAFIRRLFTDPVTGNLATMDTRRRHFPASAADFIRSRDQVCSTPYCGAPIRHTDHAQPWARGGRTTITNANGKCATCNFVKDAAGWHTVTNPDGSITTTTPTGHRYVRVPPPPPESEPWPDDAALRQPAGWDHDDDTYAVLSAEQAWELTCRHWEIEDSAEAVHRAA